MRQLILRVNRPKKIETAATMKSSDKPNAVVVGSGLNALGVVRSLAAEGIQIDVVDEAPGGPAARSRFATPRLYAARGNPAESLVHQLLSRPWSKIPPILFLTQESTVHLASAHREALANSYRFLLARQEVLTNLMDKSRFQALATEFRLPVPRSVSLERAQEAGLAKRLTFPCILKPVSKNEAWERHYKKAYRFEQFADLEKFCSTLMGEQPPLIVQEWIEGADSDVYFTLVYRDESGNTCAEFTGRKIRQWPPQVGGTASCIAAPEEAHHELSRLTAKFFSAVGFVGMGSMEFKRDVRSGRFVMVEPTVGRSDYQEEVATLNGINVVRAAYRSLAGMAPIPDEAKQGAMWRDPVGDARSQLAQPDLQIPTEGQRAVRVDALLRTNDPWPWLTDFGGRVGSRLRRLIH